VDEFWDPKSPDLEALKVTREIPALVVALSKTPIDGSAQQSKNYLETFLDVASAPSAKSAKSSGRRPKVQRGDPGAANAGKVHNDSGQNLNKSGSNSSALSPNRKDSTAARPKSSKPRTPVANADS
jgi:hypothetical protein